MAMAEFMPIIGNSNYIISSHGTVDYINYFIVPENIRLFFYTNMGDTLSNNCGFALQTELSKHARCEYTYGWKHKTCNINYFVKNRCPLDTIPRTILEKGQYCFNVNLHPDYHSVFKSGIIDSSRDPRRNIDINIVESYPFPKTLYDAIQQISTYNNSTYGKVLIDIHVLTCLEDEGVLKTKGVSAMNQRLFTQKNIEILQKTNDALKKQREYLSTAVDADGDTRMEGYIKVKVIKF